MNPSQSNGINPAMLAAFQNNQQQQQFNNQYAHQQQPQQSYPQAVQPKQFQYNNGAQYPGMYQGGGQPAQNMQGGVNPASLMNNGRANMPPMNHAQMPTTAQMYKPNMPPTNGINPAAVMGGGNTNMSNMFNPQQMASLANLSGQDRQKAMLYLQHQHQQKLLQQQQAQMQLQQQSQSQQQQQPQQSFDRPPSAMSGQQNMLPPPRPPTSMSRPGTSHSQNPPQQSRPPSRPSTAQPHPVQQQQSGFPMPGTPNLGMQQQDHMDSPDSPYRGAKRKLSSTGMPPVQTPRMGSQGLPMGMPTGMPDNSIGMAGSPQPFSGGMGPQSQFNGRGGGLGMGMGNGPMGPPIVPRPNHQAPSSQQPQQMNLHQSFEPASDRNFAGGASSPSNMASFMNGFQQPQMSGTNGMLPGGPSSGSPAGLTPAMLAQLQQHQQQQQTVPNSIVPPSPAGPPGVGNFGQMLNDPRMSTLSANAMASLIGSGAGKMQAPLGGVTTPQRPPRISASNSMNYPNAASSSSAIPPISAPQVPRAPPPSLPTAAALNPKVTQISAVSLAASLKEIPPLEDEQIAEIKEWMEMDKEYEERYKAMRERMGEEVNSVIRNPEWWERDDSAATLSRTRREKFGIGLSGARVGRRKGRQGVKLPRKIPLDEANKPELLVPVRLELDIEHHKMRDTFVWNLNDPVISPEMFAQSIVEDYNLPSSSQLVITKAIQEQLSDFKAHAGDEEFDVTAVDENPRGGLLEDDAEWWEGWRKRLRNENGFVRRKKRRMGFDSTSGADDHVNDLESDDNEMRILIKLDIIVGSIKLEDQFEWDLNNMDGGAPEQFAEVYSKELGLSGEFKTAIAHCIREQTHTYQKSLFLVGHPSDGTLVPDEDLRTSFLPSLSSGVARSLDQVPAFTPLLNYLSDGELERSEKEREKELTRRRRKTTRGRRGVALPDRDPLKTCRTPAIGFPEVDSSALINAAIAPPTTKRAAAAAASLTIANMVASENGTALMQPSAPMNIPTATPAQHQKEKKSRGLFKAPSYPSSVLRPRALVSAPTPSTGLDSSRPPVSVDGGSTAPESSRGGAKIVSAKKARELEKEAREREYFDGQHPNWIDGVWHCSNCGCPESIAIGRRKGPLGDKSQCGTCGKYWHRHRRPRPVEYSADLEFHQNQKSEAEQTRVAATRRRRNVINDSSDQSVTHPDGDDDDEPLTSLENVLPEGGLSSADPVHRPASPASSDSSGSESPLAQRVRMNGNNTSTFTPAPTSTAEATSIDDPDHNQPQPQSTPAPVSTGNSQPSNLPRSPSTQQTAAPEWLREAVNSMQRKYPDDRFGLTLRHGRPGVPAEQPGWRIKCNDCPGKLYTAGPGNTLSNFEVHLKNRQHRGKVSTRVGTPMPS